MTDELRAAWDRRKNAIDLKVPLIAILTAIVTGIGLAWIGATRVANLSSRLGNNEAAIVEMRPLVLRNSDAIIRMETKVDFIYERMGGKFKKPDEGQP